VGDPDSDRLKELFVELEFHGLVREIAAPEPETEQLASSYRIVSGVADVRELAGEIRERGAMSVHVVGSSTSPLRAEVAGLAVGLEPGKAWYLPLAHRRAGELDLGDHAGLNLPALADPEMAPLVEVLEDASIRKVGHDLKYALLALGRLGPELKGLDFDVMVASYLLEPGRREQELDSIALQRLGHSATSREDLCGKGRSETPVVECAIEAVRDFACEKADLALRLEERLANELPEYHLERLFRDVEMPLIPVLADMERAGIGIDVPFFEQVSAKLDRDLRLIESDIYKEAGEEFNINSTPQLREVLFEKLELPVLKRTKTGPSTDATVLEELAEQGHRIPTLILEYRQLDKLKNTYVDALPQLVDPGTGRIHTSFNQTVAATGRLSSSDPNVQNIPIRTQVGAELRKGFVPADGFRFVAADYSQIELRVLAHLSGDETFTRAFRSGADIHRETAALVFEVEADDVTPQMRDAAKTINFATIYGIGPYALSKQLGTSVQEAKAFIDNYFERLPQVRKYLDAQIEKAYETGYVETIAGRRRYIPEVKSKNYNIRQFGERAATNAPVQGSAADIIKIAMIEIRRALADRTDGTRMLLQVHDDLLFETPESAVEEVKALITGLMEGAFELDVPLRVEVGTGSSWYECK
jgi:DNA polymerase-1